MGHVLELAPRYRIGLGCGRHPLIISDGRRIVHEHMPSAAAEGKNPVRPPPGNQVKAGNEDDDHAPRLECPLESRVAHRSLLCGEPAAIGAPRLGPSRFRTRSASPPSWE